MAGKPRDKNAIPALIQQNPALVDKESHEQLMRISEQADRVMEVFLRLVPSNYVSQVRGPFYTTQFQAVAEQIARIQITAQEIWADHDYDYTRPEFLYQILGTLVFPDATEDGHPIINGDLTYREFLKRMVILLLQGSKKATIEDGLALVTDADIEVLERAILARTTPNSAWGLEDQFTFEVNVSDNDAHGESTFPEDPITLQENVRVVLRALRPAHTLYDYRHLFREVLGHVFDEATIQWENYEYEDLRKFCAGSKFFFGTAGVSGTDKRLWWDWTRDFSAISRDSRLTILSGPNSIHSGGQEGTVASQDRRHVGRYRVVDVLVFPFGDDPTPRAYTTSSGLAGRATVSGSDVEDLDQDFSGVAEGETITFTEGPNIGTYRMVDALRATRVRVAPSILRLDRGVGETATKQSYTITLDHMGIQEPHVVVGEDVSVQFVL